MIGKINIITSKVEGNFGNTNIKQESYKVNLIQW